MSNAKSTPLIPKLTMKTNRNYNVYISTLSLLVSLVCLAGLVQVECKFYTNEQTQRAETGQDTIAITKDSSQKYLWKATTNAIIQEEIHTRYRRQAPKDTKPPGPIDKSTKAGQQGLKGPRGPNPQTAPSILVPPKNLVVNVSDTVRLQCSVKGNPAPMVTWAKNNSSIPSGSHVIDKVLTIQRVNENDGGVYTCTAKNVLGVVKANILLTVQFPPVFTFTPKSSIVEENTNVTLDCGASGLPRPNILWTNMYGDLYQNKRAVILSNNSLVITDTRKKDEGTYICIAENVLGGVGTHAQITVFPALKFTFKPPSQLQLPLDFQILLDCQAANALGVMWRKDNKPLDPSITVYSNGTLVIPKAALQDSGLYTCIARNFYRSIETTTNLTMYQKPDQYPSSCSVLKTYQPSASSGNYVIDPDGQSGVSQFTVYCDMNDKGGVGVTVVSHDSEARTLVDGYEDRGTYSKDISYNGISMAQLAKLTEISTNCEQFIIFECFNDVALLDFGGYGWWVSRDGLRQNYWGGATPGSGKCACGMTNTCMYTSQPCNCCSCSRNSGWLSDSGLLTDKSTLPVSQLRFGDTGDLREQGYHTLGKLKCYG